MPSKKNISKKPPAQAKSRQEQKEQSDFLELRRRADKALSTDQIDDPADIFAKAIAQGVDAGHVLGRPEDSIGQRIKDAREKRNLTQETLSQYTKRHDPDGKGISRSVLAYYEKGRFKPGARELRILYAALGLTPNWLVLGEADPERLREFRKRFKSDKVFFSALLDALKKLDSDSLNGAANLIFAASANTSEFEKLAGDLTQFADDLMGEFTENRDTLEKLKTSPKTKQKNAPSKS